MAEPGELRWRAARPRLVLGVANGRAERETQRHVGEDHQLGLVPGVEDEAALKKHRAGLDLEESASSREASTSWKVLSRRYRSQQIPR